MSAPSQRNVGETNPDFLARMIRAGLADISRCSTSLLSANREFFAALKECPDVLSSEEALEIGQLAYATAFLIRWRDREQTRQEAAEAARSLQDLEAKARKADALYRKTVKPEISPP